MIGRSYIDIDKGQSRSFLKIVSFIAFIISFGFFIFSVFAIIPIGHIGIQVIFGKASSDVFQNGLKIKNPFAKIEKMNARIQELKETVQVLSKEGLVMDLDVSLLYRLNPQTAFKVYTEVGVDYCSIIIEPQLRSIIREVTASYEAKILYSSERDKISNEMYRLFKAMTEDKGIIIDQLLLRDIGLPDGVSKAIELKLESEQEAERKRIEAKGISDFQDIVTEGINENLLKWKGIAATEALAKSPNSKIIVIGGKDGMPLILNSSSETK